MAEAPVRVIIVGDGKPGFEQDLSKQRAKLEQWLKNAKPTLQPKPTPAKPNF